MSVIAPLKDLESNEDDSDVLKETERVMFEELSDRYSDQHTLHTGKPRLYIFFAMNEPHHVVPTVPCVRGGCAHIHSDIPFILLLISINVGSAHQRSRLSLKLSTLD